MLAEIAPAKEANSAVIGVGAASALRSLCLAPCAKLD
jgi:hypothetical protein